IFESFPPQRYLTAKNEGSQKAQGKQSGYKQHNSSDVTLMDNEYVISKQNIPKNVRKR
ncbi:22642_t:CDS:2, partial [Gigaspora rosea]